MVLAVGSRLYDAHKAWNKCPLSFVDRNPGLTRFLCGLIEAGLICKQ